MRQFLTFFLCFRVFGTHDRPMLPDIKLAKLLDSRDSAPLSTSSTLLCFKLGDLLHCACAWERPLFHRVIVLQTSLFYVSVLAFLGFLPYWGGEGRPLPNLTTRN